MKLKDHVPRMKGGRLLKETLNYEQKVRFFIYSLYNDVLSVTQDYCGE
jgi:hypothetical protein